MTKKNNARAPDSVNLGPEPVLMGTSVWAKVKHIAKLEMWHMKMAKNKADLLVTTGVAVVAAATAEMAEERVDRTIEKLADLEDRKPVIEMSVVPTLIKAKVPAPVA